MMTLTRHVMDHELPYVLVRQWVLSMPFALRYRLAYDQSLCTAVHRILTSAVQRRLKRLARGRGHTDAHSGSVCFVQRYGGGLNLNPHLHLLSLDGWFHRSAEGLLLFESAPAPSQRDVEALVLDAHRRVMRLLLRRGLLEMGADDALAQDAPALSACYEGAVTQTDGLGPARGRPVMKLRVPLSEYLASAAERLERGGLLVRPRGRLRLARPGRGGGIPETAPRRVGALLRPAAPLCCPQRVTDDG